MIQIKYSNKDYSLEIKGHAGYAPHGQDILCASVSALSYALAEFICRNIDLLKSEPEIVLENGWALIKCTPKKRFSNTFQIAFSTIMGGFELLHKNYPYFLKIMGPGLEK
jgi:uncharacterized protein YsxB (DUF464 family)|nr:MAG TPA: YsxB-like protein [Caudoviricetes sp.]